MLIAKTEQNKLSALTNMGYYRNMVLLLKITRICDPTQKERDGYYHFTHHAAFTQRNGAFRHFVCLRTKRHDGGCRKNHVLYRNTQGTTGYIMR